jgi:hypothetical protein
MKLKNVLLTALAVAGLLALPRIANAAINKGIEGSAHDFSTNSWNLSRKGVCSACHSAHHTDDAQIAPLWNHATSAAVFTPYTSPTLTAAVGAPSGVSLACLSCHDGTVAVNQSMSGSFTGGTAVMIDPSAVIGPDLHTTHPISFTYDTTLATTDGGLEDPSTYLIGDAKTNLTYSTAPVPATWSGSSLTGKTIDEALLFNGTMQCASCHDVHKLDGSSPESGIFLRISGADAGGKGSTLCRTCHIK